MDSLPQLRFPEFRLPRGKNAVLYRGLWTVRTDYGIDVTGMDPEKDLVAVSVPKNVDFIDEEWENILGANRRVTRHYPANLDYSRQNANGLNALQLGYGYNGRYMILNSSWTANAGGSDSLGTLLASRLPVEELVEKFRYV